MRKVSTTISPERRAPPSPSSRAGRRRCPRSAISSRSSIAGARARRCRRLPTHGSSSDGTMNDRIAPVALLIGALVLVSAPSDAETYRWVDEQGHVLYSDRPPPAAAFPPDGARPTSHHPTDAPTNALARRRGPARPPPGFALSRPPQSGNHGRVAANSRRAQDRRTGDRGVGARCRPEGGRL